MKHNYFQEEKLKYEEIEIPEELLLMVRRTVAADRRKKAAAWRARVVKIAGSVAAILFLCLTIGVNSSYAFAETAIKIPVVKSVAKVVIVRSYRADIIALDEENNKAKRKKDVEQEPEEEEALSVSDNNTVSGNEMPEQPADGQEPEDALEGIEAWKAEMTPEKLKEITEIYTPDMEERYADAPEKLRTILLAELPEKDVSLYGYHENGQITGTALRVKDTCQYYDWNYMNSTKKLPEISFADADGDGEEELVVLLYNGEPQKEMISKADIEAPDKAAEENKEDTEVKNSDGNKEPAEDVISDQDKTTAGNKSADKTVESSENIITGKETDAADAGKTKVSAKEETKDSTQEVTFGDDTNEMAAGSSKPSVSGNDIKVTEKPKGEQTEEPTKETVKEPTKETTKETAKEPKPQAGELWIISLKEENWSASVLSVDDYESQIIHQLKAEYDEEAGAVSLYLMEEPFGKPEKLQGGEEEDLTYEAVNLAPEREIVAEKGLFLYFGMEADFVNAEGEEVAIPLSLKLKAEIHLEDDGSLIIENIKER